VILPDINLLIHAYNSHSPVHSAARRWWEERLTEDAPIEVPWIVILGFLRLVTHHQIAANPLPISSACGIVESWLARPQVSVLHPGKRHPEILFGFLRAIGAGGNLTTDAHLAALAVEHDLEICTTDRDFGRFPGLRWRNPLTAG
jgi:toxin-antitoxin system PIN domain toxin